MIQYFSKVAVSANLNDATSHAAILHANGIKLEVSLGRSGFIKDSLKSEGDGATPIGTYRILKLFYRADRVTLPDLPQFEIEAITPGMGWCDDPESERYNCLVREGLAPHHPEAFMRDDARYNIISVLDHNGAWPHDAPNPNPAEPGRGSAIFMHVWGLEDGAPLPTAGCVAMDVDALVDLLRRCDPDTEFVLGTGT